MTDKTLPWIQTGYKTFAYEGPQALKVEVLAKKVGKSKSSFYHHFADLEVFTEFLLNHHLEQAAKIAERERECKNVDPELLQLLIEVKEDLLFNRQLRIHRENPAFHQCFEQASQTVGEAIGKVWAEYLGLKEHHHLALVVLKLSQENFYLQITEENLNYEWLQAYMKELRAMVLAFQQMEQSKPKLFGEA